MSIYTFFASNKPLNEVKNTSIELLSIEEAKKRNIYIHNCIKKNNNIDPNEKIILFCKNEESLNEIEITVDNDSYCPRYYTKKPYISTLSWKYSASRSLQIFEYITNHLETTKEIEIWNIWLDKRETPIIKKCMLHSLSESDIKDTIGKDFFDLPRCLVVEV